MSPTQPSEDLAAMVSRREWYHTIELAPGVVTPGWFDPRPVAARLPWPDLRGKRCLDVATFDGFWGIEMWRRGAAEVVAIDILDEERWDWPARTSPETVAAITARKGAGDGFELVRDVLRHPVERLDTSVYDLDPGEHGTFDFVYVGSLLLHLRDPVLALERVRRVCRGTLMSVDAFDPWLTATNPCSPVARLEGTTRPYWWKVNLRGLRQVIHSAGFDVLTRPRPFLMPAGEGFHHPPLTLEVLRDPVAREQLIASRIGDPHAFALARPAAAT